MNKPITAAKYVTVAKYHRITGLPYQSIYNALEAGQLRAIRTKGGYWKVEVNDNIRLSEVDTKGVTQ